MINVKLWGARLSGKESARAFRNKFAPAIKHNQTTEFNMAGIKDITQGFVLDAFGPLYMLAKIRGGKIEFKNTPKHLKPIVLAGMRAAIK